jgi:hypothetical protein
MWLVLAAISGCATTGEPASDDTADENPDEDPSDGPDEIDAGDPTTIYDARPGQPDAPDGPDPIDASPPIDAGPSFDAKPFDKKVIDDLDDGNDQLPMVDGRRGFWYVYHDTTVGGVQTPPDTDFNPTAMGASGSAYAARTTGSGFTEWGAGMGFDINVGPENNALKGTFDAGAYTGISFQAKGSVPIRVLVQTAGVLPEAQGGTCVPGTTPGTECEDAHGKDIALTTAWKEYQVPFAGLTQAGWGKVVSFDKKKLTAVFFQVNPNVSFDVWIDEVKLY